MKVIIQRHIYSNAPAEPGIWCLRAERFLDAVPREGDWIELADGWSSECVKDATFMADGRVLVELRHVKTDNPEMLAEDHRLVDSHDWEWLGPAPARTEPGPG